MRAKEMSIEKVFEHYLEWLESKRGTVKMLRTFEDLDKQNRGTFFYPWWVRVRESKKK